MTTGIYPASVTPLDENGSVDYPSLARLLAYFEAAGCAGAVLAGTNGEGPSLSAVEKRDLIREAMPLRGKLELIIGIATPSLEEAVWLANQAEKAGAAAALVMAPGYFREAGEEGIQMWFSELLDRSRLPVIVYNFPQRTGITLGSAVLCRLAEHPNFVGVKDSSSSIENLSTFASTLLPLGKRLYVGDEALLIQALEAGWSGSISGAANSIPRPLVEIVSDWRGGLADSARSKHALALPTIRALRSAPQPAAHKLVLSELGVIQTAQVRLPLKPCNREESKPLLNQVQVVVNL